MLKEWSDAYCIGIPEIDRQHRGFVEAANRLMTRSSTAVASGASRRPSPS